jgi:hypothetical protein
LMAAAPIALINFEAASTRKTSSNTETMVILRPFC